MNQVHSTSEFKPGLETEICGNSLLNCYFVMSLFPRQQQNNALHKHFKFPETKSKDRNITMHGPTY